MRKPNKNRKMEIVICACGCGEKLNKYDERNRERKYIKNHSYKVKHDMQFKKGMIPWNKGKKGLVVGWNKGKSMKDYPQCGFQVGHKIGVGNKYNLGRKLTEEQKSEKSKIAKEKGYGKWMKGKKLTKEHIKNSLRRREMSSLEITLNNLIKENNLPYKFVGNGKFFIERKNPDFINTNGVKLAVEVFDNKHKEIFRGGVDNWKKERRRIFAKYGWNISFIEKFDLIYKKEGVLTSLRKGVEYH